MLISELALVSLKKKIGPVITHNLFFFPSNLARSQSLIICSLRDSHRFFFNCYLFFTYWLGLLKYFPPLERLV